MLSVLTRLVKRRPQAWPDTRLVLRGDSHFASPEVMQWSEAQANLPYVTGMTSNSVLQNLAPEVGEQAKRAYARDGVKGYPLPLDTLSGRNVAASASRGDHG